MDNQTMGMIKLADMTLEMQRTALKAIALGVTQADFCKEAQLWYEKMKDLVTVAPQVQP